MIFHLTSNLNKKTSVVRVLRAVKEIPRNKLWYFLWSPVETVIIWPLLLFFADLATWIHQEITKYYTSYHGWFPALRQYKRSIMMEFSEWIYSKSPVSRAMWLSVCPHHLADCRHLVVSAGRIPPHHWLKSVSVNLLWLYPKDQRLGAFEQRLLYRGNLMFMPFYNTAHHYKEFLSVLRVFTFKSKSNLYNSDYQAAKVLQVNCSNKGNSVWNY